MVHGLQWLWLMGSREQAQQLWHTGLVAPQHAGSSWTRDQTQVPCTGRRILNHCTTREVPVFFFLKKKLFFSPLNLSIYLSIYLFCCVGSQLRCVRSLLRHGGSLVDPCRIISCGIQDFQLRHTNSQLQYVGSSSLARDGTRAPSTGSAVFQPLEQQGSPSTMYYVHVYN